MKVLRYTLLILLMIGWVAQSSAQSVGCLEGNCKDGWGIYKFSSGSEYIGYFKDGKRDGYGYYKFVNKDEYIGDWKNDQRHGTGTYIYATLGMYRQYVGEWDENKRSGIGIMYYYHGKNKLGNWENNEFKGKVNGGKPGCAQGDCQNGFGLYVFKTGAIYKGQYKDGKRNGFGTHYYPKGSRYTGFQVDGLRNGIGIYSYPSGGRYVGDWEDEKREGDGVLFAKGKIQSEGYWSNGQFVFTQLARKEVKEKAGLLSVSMSQSPIAKVEDNTTRSTKEEKDTIQSPPTNSIKPPVVTGKSSARTIEEKPGQEDKIKKKSIKPVYISNTDAAPPTLVLKKPVFKHANEAIIVNESVIMITGAANDPSGIISVRVNNKAATLTKESAERKGFAIEVNLLEGENLLNIRAIDRIGNAKTYTYKVIYEVVSGYANSMNTKETLANEKRTALVIGNSEYLLSPLRNATNDANAIAKKLEDLGFDVVVKIDLDQKDMKRTIRDFGNTLKENGGVGLFYYAGHGLQVKGENYLMPIGAEVEKELDVELESVRLQRVLNELEWASNRLNIVVLDACRDNPYTYIRSLNDGLAPVNRSPVGTYITYATAPGESASDGDGEHGLFTQELLKVLDKDDFTLKLEDVFKRVRVSVREKSRGNQVPWDNSTIEGDFYFKR